MGTVYELVDRYNEIVDRYNRIVDCYNGGLVYTGRFPVSVRQQIVIAYLNTGVEDYLCKRIFLLYETCV